ncbi:MAG: RIP metalloprotease RseP [Bacilli bacterium]|nr:RIP metalloprotease RseP [Bacilli bacterium]MDD4077829.1 RIP metalloprotease RseP [Bacilli bacterium]MDD4388903.1 RIP metalloprotease RseP [Bacilli bacterium]
MEFFYILIGFILILGIIIAVHEGGHYIFAKKAGILVREFSFGMGPQLIKKKKGETVYSLRAFPIGGFCAIAGEEFEGDPFANISRVKLDIEKGVIKGFYLDFDNPEINYPEYVIVGYDLYDKGQTGNLYMDVDENGNVIRYPVDPQAIIYERKTEMQIAPYNRTLGAKSKKKRAMVMFGGPLMNFLLALVVFFLAGLIQGFPDFSTSTVSFIDMDKVNPTPAYEAGLRTGDIITKLKAGDLIVEINEWSDISDFMSKYTTTGKTDMIEVKYNQGDTHKTVFVNPQIKIYNIDTVGQFTGQGIKVIKVNKHENEMANNKELNDGDIIVEINGVSYLELTNMYRELTEFSGEDPKEKISLKVIRNDEIKDITVRPYSKAIMEKQIIALGEPIVKIEIGINPIYKFSLLKSFIYSGERTIKSFTAIYDSFYLLFKDKTVTIKAFSGPVGIAAIIGSVMRQGVVNIFALIGLLSVNVGLLNLLPIPALDGGRLVFLGYEAITGKKPNQKVETALITVTMLLLLAFMVFVTFNDILGLFK